MVPVRRDASRWGAYAALGIGGVLLVATAGYGAQHGATKHRKDASQNQAQTQSPTTPPLPVVVQVEPSPKEVQRAAEQETQQRRIFGLEPEGWNLIFSALLLISNALLWTATKDNARAAKRAASIAQKALVDLEIPYVFVRFPKAGLKTETAEIPQDDGGIEIEFSSKFDGDIKLLFVNFGRTPAILKDSLVVYDNVAGHSEMPYPIDPIAQRGAAFPVGTVTANNDPHEVSKNAYFAWGEIDPRNLDVIKDRFFCLGYLRYEDILGGRYVLGFCAYFNWLTGRFELIGDDKYNYVRTEIDPRDQ